MGINYVPFQSTLDEGRHWKLKRGEEKMQVHEQSWVLELQVVSEGSGGSKVTKEGRGDPGGP